MSVILELTAGPDGTNAVDAEGKQIVTFAESVFWGDNVVGRRIGSIYNFDPTLTYSFRDGGNASGRYRFDVAMIVDENGVERMALNIYVADVEEAGVSLFDFEDESFHIIDIVGKDADGAEQAHGTFKVQLTDVNEAPTDILVVGDDYTTPIDRLEIAESEVGDLGFVYGVDPDGDEQRVDNIAFDDAVENNANAWFSLLQNDDGAWVLSVKDGLDYDDLANGKLQEDENGGRYYIVGLKATDKLGLSTSKPLRVYVSNNGGDDNAAPVIGGVAADVLGEAGAAGTPDEGTIVVYENEGAGIVAKVTATDAPGDALTYSLIFPEGSNYTTLFSIDGNGNISITDPAALNLDADTNFTFQVKVTDAGGLEAVQDVIIRVKDVAVVGSAPTNVRFNSVNVDASVRENTGADSTIAEITADDLDGDALRFTLVDSADGRFKLVKDAGTGRWLIKVDRSIGIDFEQNKFHTIQVQAHEDKVGGLSSEIKTLRINIRDSLIEIVTEKDTSDKIFGGAFGDNLRGGKGNDTLRGNAGNDTLTGGEGDDIFQFQSTPNAATNKDVIKDFKVGTNGVENDMIWLNRQFGFTGFLSTEANKILDENAFVLGAVATQARAQILYNKATGELFYDADGTVATKAPVLFAVLDPLSRPDLTHANFWIYSGL